LYQYAFISNALSLQSRSLLILKTRIDIQYSASDIRIFYF